ncbi:hypothetical protein PRZ48_008868 [Zasmidium cellare]|uniref:Uncharacterized protein n=1 Tax=Zasmidium cellare TaxID=395010 RepID=A0ABR0EGQ7_ZASCE|nr:hypothetical protein PRZ48_008868 [Zasmidium cellare]
MPRPSRRRVIKPSSRHHPLRWSTRRPQSSSATNRCIAKLRRRIRDLQGMEYQLMTTRAELQATENALKRADEETARQYKHGQHASRAFARLREKVDRETMPLYAERLEGRALWEAILAEIEPDRSQWRLLYNGIGI